MHDLNLLDPAYASLGGDGASAMTDADVFFVQHQRKVRALGQDETGLSFASLALFAEPLFDLYDLDPAAAFEVMAQPDEADETTVVVLEAARVLWAYFSLPAKERTRRYADLAAFLIGPDAEPEDEADFDRLLDTLETHWDALTPDDHRLAEAVEADTLGFDALLAHPAFAHGQTAPPAERTYGPNGLSEPDARALFAEPMLEGVTDPDEFDDAMDRADEYWTLAHLHGPERAAHLDGILSVFAVNEAQADALRREAEQMTDRFQSLFPEQG
ncbi:MAG: hypothetical protein AAGI91_05455 [Bacteroidota bacterium]